jgi:hypothetical protein
MTPSKGPGVSCDPGVGRRDLNGRLSHLFRAGTMAFSEDQSPRRGSRFVERAQRCDSADAGRVK